tara:strand:+ start:102 stop:575 length:474 start_codon:yes stop_codon:yes gene_type:complete
MIISCEKCYKKFNINSDLIPEKGRLLQCSSCEHKWFFKRIQIEEKTLLFDEIITDEMEEKSSINNKNVYLQSNKTKTPKKFKDKNLDLKTDKNIQKKQKKLKILNKILVLIITFAAVTILIDTFKGQISKIYPNIEFVLYNLYESFKDLFLFFKDLI